MRKAGRPRRLSRAERAEAARRFAQIRSGEIRIPAACPHCFSSSLEPCREDEDPHGKDLDAVRCISCGRTAHRNLIVQTRRQRIRSYLIDGSLG